MANCTLCGKNLGMFSNEAILLPKDEYNDATYIKVCGDCKRKYFQAMDFDEKNFDEESFDENKKEILQAISNSNDAIKRRIQSVLDTKREEIEKSREKKEAERANQIILERKNILKQEKILITTGYSFEGYRIVKYLNIVNGEIVMGTGFLSELSASLNDMLGTASGTIGGKLSKAKQEVQSQLIEKSIGRGANALIGVEFDISVLGNNMLMVSANGTAVVIEKSE